MRSYLKLIKFHYHITFLLVIFGAVSFHPESSLALAGPLFLLYLSFNVLLYGGIYTLNDLADIDLDRKHPLKRNRPLASGEITTRAAISIAVALITAGLLSALLCFGVGFLAIFLAFVALNGFYSIQARGIPYLELFVNSATYPLRYLMGVTLAGSRTPAHHLLAVSAVAFGIVCLRRILEMDIDAGQARPAISRYSRIRLLLFQFLALTVLIALFITDPIKSVAFYATAFLLYLVIVFGPQLSMNARGLLRAIWTR